MPDAKLGRVVGLAASDLLDPKNPRSPSNRRITITVLTREAEERLMGKGIPEITSTELLNEKREIPPQAGNSYDLSPNLPPMTMPTVILDRKGPK